MRSQFIVFLFLFLSALTSNANAEPPHLSMNGIKNVSIDIDISEVDKSIRINRSQLKARIEKLFNSGGIKIGSGTAVLDIDVYTVGISDHGYLYGITAYLAEPAILSRTGVVPVAVITWEETEDGVSSNSRIKSAIQDNLDIISDNFVTDYKKDNLISATTPPPTSKSANTPATPK